MGAAMLKLAVLVLGIAALTPSAADAQVFGVQVKDGNVYVQLPTGLRRLTRDGQSTEAAKSRDGSLIAYIHKDSAGDSGSMNSLSVCVVAEQKCRIVTQPKSSDKPEENLTDATTPVFSYQASARPDGSVVGSLYFLTTAWTTSGAVYRVKLGPVPSVSYVTPSNALSVVPSGKFAGALDVAQHSYGTGGSCDQERIFDPNTKKVLQNIPTPDCQGLGIQ